MNPIYKQAIDKFGLPHQEDKLIEEMAELTQAIIKHRQNPSAESSNLLYEEFTDVQIVMKQIKTILNKQTLAIHKEGKLSSLEKLLAD